MCPPIAILTLTIALQHVAGELPTGDWAERGLDPEHRSDIRQAFQNGIDNKFIPGGALLIIYKGEAVLHEGFGVSDLESGLPFSANAHCRIASLTKPHTATLLALLQGRGVLSLDDPVGKFLPAFNKLETRDKNGLANPITLKMCLSHTAGFASNNQLKSGEFTLDFNGSLAEVVDELATRELFYGPGTSYGYGRLGYMTAARVAEVATGSAFESLMEEVLFKTLGSRNSTFDYEKMKPRIPTAYERTQTGFKPRVGEPIGTVINPGGSLIATPTDVARLLLLHRNQGLVDGRRVVPKGALQEMYESQPGRGNAAYGLGFNIIAKGADGDAVRIQHTGAAGTIGIIDFELDLIVIIFTQVPQTQTNQWRRPLLSTIFNAFRG